MVEAGEVIVNLQTRLMPGAADLLRAHERAMPHKDELCGALGVWDNGVPVSTDATW